MLKQIIEKNHFLILEKADSWQDAIEQSCKMLIKDGSVSKDYPLEIIKCIEKYGPYIIVLPKIAIPHSQEYSKNVSKTAVSLLKLNQPVSFDENDEEKSVDLFFTLSSKNHKLHLENIEKLTNILLNEELVNELHNIQNEQQLKELSKKYNI